MKLKILGFLTALVVSFTAHASPVLLGSASHDYGTGAGQVSPASQGAGSCDVMSANAVGVRSASNCQRFFDSFDLSAYAGDVIDSFALTLNFANARNETFGFERWAPRPASSSSVGSSQVQTFLAATGPQTWIFDSSLDVFADIVSAGSFTYWMSREFVFGVNTVNLDWARLEVYGTPANDVPLPGTLSLIGAGLLGLAAVSRRRSKQGLAR